jgi:hypothetical protein
MLDSLHRRGLAFACSTGGATCDSSASAVSPRPNSVLFEILRLKVWNSGAMKLLHCNLSIQYQIAACNSGLQPFTHRAQENQWKGYWLHLISKDLQYQVLNFNIYYVSKIRYQRIFNFCTFQYDVWIFDIKESLIFRWVYVEVWISKMMNPWYKGESI